MRKWLLLPPIQGVGGRRLPHRDFLRSPTGESICRKGSFSLPRQPEGSKSIPLHRQSGELPAKTAKNDMHIIWLTELIIEHIFQISKGLFRVSSKVENEKWPLRLI